MKANPLENLTWNNISESEFDSTVMINVTERCNLNCTYCYEHSKKGRDLDMKKAISKLDQVLYNFRSHKKVAISFSGGEPLLGFDSIQGIFQHMVKKYISNKDWKTEYFFSLTTNGTLLTPQMKKWFNQHRCFSLGLSLDGTPEAHNRNRSGSYEAVAKNFDFFRKYNTPVKMTIGPHTVSDCAAGIRHIHSLGFEATSNVVFEDVWGNEEEHKKYLQIFSEQLSELIDFYSDNLQFPRTNLVRPVIEYLPINEDIPVQRYCGAGTRMMLIDVDGRDYPCHRFSPMSNKRKCSDIDFDTVTIKPAKCANCALVAMCPNCCGFNYEYHGDVDQRTTFHCEFFKLQARSASVLIFRDIERLKSQDRLTKLVDQELEETKLKLRSALFIEEYTRPAYKSMSV